MPVLFRDTVTRQPQYPAAINWGHPLAPKRGFIVSQHGGMTLLHWRGGRYALNIGQQIYDQAYRGVGAPGVSTAVGGVTLPVFGGAGTDGCTVLFVASKHSAATVSHRVFDVDVGGTASSLAGWNPGASRWFFSTAVSGVGSNQFEITAGSSLTSGDVVAFINDGTGTGTTGYIRGQSVSVTQTVGPQVGSIAGLSGLSNFYIGNRADGARGWDGPIGFIYFDQTQRAAAEVGELSRNVWQIFQAPARKLWLSGAAGGSASTGTGSTTLDNLTLSATASITAQGQASIALAGVTLSAAGSITAQGAANITLADLSLSAAGSVTNRGQAAITLADATLAAEGESTTGANGSAAITLADLTLTAAGSITARGAAAFTLADLGLSAAGALTNRGQAAITLGALLLSASGANSDAVTYTRAPRGGGYPATVQTTERYGTTNTKRPAMTNTRR